MDLDGWDGNEIWDGMGGQPTTGGGAPGWCAGAQVVLYGYAG